MYDTRCAKWWQMLLEAASESLLMHIDEDGCSCLFYAAQEGLAGIVEVGAGGGRQREVGGRVSAATAHGTWCRGCRQHTATRCNKLHHV